MDRMDLDNTRCTGNHCHRYSRWAYVS